MDLIIWSFLFPTVLSCFVNLFKTASGWIIPPQTRDLYGYLTVQILLSHFFSIPRYIALGLLRSWSSFNFLCVFILVCLWCCVLMFVSPLLFSPVHFPGKCMSHTSSTYTFTTCRILHPTDELTRVTPR